MSNITLKKSLSKISFCNKECFNINNNHTKESIINHIQEKYKLQIINKQYVLINPHMIRNISYHEHLLSTFTNGNPYLLYLTKIDNINCSIFIDRKLKTGYSYPKIHCVQYKFDNELFENDTMFTGELVRDINHNWLFLISDLLIHEGELTKNKNVLVRFQLIHDILDKYYTKDENVEICPIYVKKLFQYNQINEIFTDFMPSLSYVCKGIVFYTLNSQFSNYAWITPREHQIKVYQEDELLDKFFKKYPDYLQYKNIKNDELDFINEFTKTTNNNYQMSNNSNQININNHNNNQISNNNLQKNNKQENSKQENCKQENSKQENSKQENCTLENCTLENSEKENCKQKINDNQIINGNQAILNIIKTDIPDIYHLYCADDNKNKVGVAFIPNMKISHKLYDYFEINKNDLNCKVICNYHTFFEKWIPVDFTNKDSNTKEELINIINLNIQTEN